jgi:hypothetical protein
MIKPRPVVTLKSAKARRIVRKVLKIISTRSKTDYQRLQRRIRRIVPVTIREAADGTRGEWLRDIEVDVNDYGSDHDEWPGVIKLCEKQTENKLVANFAHECGHACSTHDDWNATCAPSDEWASELSADKFAYKWGFGHLIGRYRKKRDHIHHGPGPRKTCYDIIDGYKCYYKVSRNFRMTLVRKVKI